MSGKFLWANKIVLIIFLFPIFIACTNQTKRINSAEMSTISFENGDLIYRHGNGFFSGYFMNMSNQEQLYSHGGIISIEADSIYVIHSEASEFTGIGGAKKEPLSFFLKNISTWGVYRLDTISAIRDSIVLIASEYVDKKTPFDFNFNNDSDDKVYCTQLLANSVNQAMGRNIILPKNTFRGKAYYAIDDTYLIPNVRLIHKHIKEN